MERIFELNNKPGLLAYMSSTQWQLTFSMIRPTVACSILCPCHISPGPFEIASAFWRIGRLQQKKLLVQPIRSTEGDRRISCAARRRSLRSLVHWLWTLVNVRNSSFWTMKRLSIFLIVIVDTYIVTAVLCVFLGVSSMSNYRCVSWSIAMAGVNVIF